MEAAAAEAAPVTRPETAEAEVPALQRRKYVICRRKEKNEVAYSYIYNVCSGLYPVEFQCAGHCKHRLFFLFGKNTICSGNHLRFAFCRRTRKQIYPTTAKNFAISTS